MKRILSLMLVLVIMLSSVACNTASEISGSETKEKEPSAETPIETPKENTEATPDETPAETPAETVDEAKLDDPIDLLSENVSITVVIPASADRHVNYASDSFINGVRLLTGAQIALGTTEQEVEILIGDTGRSESVELKKTLADGEFAVKLMGKKLVVVATDDAFLYEAVGVILDFIKIEDNADVSEGKILLKRSIDIKQAGDKSNYLYLFSKSDTVTAKGEHTVDLPLPSSAVIHTQGGCFDGKYFYQSFIRPDGGDETNNKVIIVKYDFETMKPVAQSEILMLNHANDITYNAELNLIAVANHGPNKSKLTFLDPETLTVLYTKAVLACYSVTYNHERDMYATGLSGGQNLRRYKGDLVFDSSLKIIYQTPKTVNYTTQGITSDENFIYCVLWDGEGYGTDKFQNVITVYDWYGNFVGIINIDVGGLEPENIIIDNGVIYVTCHTSRGARMFKINIVG